MEIVQLIKPMYKCQDVPMLVFDKRCPNPCLYCGFYGYQFSEENTLASGLENVIKKTAEFKGAYFSPTTDCFLKENIELTHYLLEEIWELNPTWVPLLITKQIIPKKTLDLLIENKDRLVLQISIPIVNDEVVQIIEPGSAKILDRLEMIKNLIDLGLKVICVVMPYFGFEEPKFLAETLKNFGIERVITATGVLTESTKKRMFNSTSEKVRKIVDSFAKTKGKYILEKNERVKILSDLIFFLKDRGIKCKICTCDNHDLEDTNLPLCHKFNHKNFKS